MHNKHKNTINCFIKAKYSVKQPNQFYDSYRNIESLKFIKEKSETDISIIYHRNIGILLWKPTSAHFRVPYNIKVWNMSPEKAFHFYRNWTLGACPDPY